MSTSVLAGPSGFGPLLRDLRRRARLTQRELAEAVGYSEGQISRLEKGARRPDPALVAGAFVPALGLTERPYLAQQLIDAAAQEKGVAPPARRPSSGQLDLVPVRPPGNLPAPPTDLLGRDSEVETLVQRMVEHPGRLLTLKGPPGIGKTRLALAVAWRLAPLQEDGAYFIPLAAIDDPALVAAAIAGELTLPDDEHTRASARLIAHLRRRNLLLVLDNFEQIIPAAALVAELLAACPELSMIVTSRESLHLRAEQRYNVPPLPAEAAQALFVARVRDIDPAFALTGENRADVEEICATLDYLPLALELSAAHSDAFSLAEIRVGLRHRPLDLLRDGPSDGHGTLRGAIQQSYELLSPDEQTLFRRLGVFIGGFQSDALTALEFPHQLLRRLVAKSMIYRLQESNEPRFALLDALRHFALEQLADVGELIRARRRHAEYMQAVVRSAMDAPPAAAKKQAYDRLEAEIYNLRAALQYLTDAEPDAALRLAGDLRDFWYVRGYNSEGRAWLTPLLEKVADGAVRAAGQLAVAQLAMAQSDYADAHAHLDAAERTFVESGDKSGLAHLLHIRGWLNRETARPEQAMDCFRRCIDLARSLDNTSLQIQALTSLATALDASGGPADEIERYLDECLALAQATRDDEARGLVLARGGTHRMIRGDFAAAADMLQQAVEIFHALGFKREEAWALEELGEAYFLSSDADAAGRAWESAGQLFAGIGESLGLMILEHHAGHLWRARARPELAEACYRRSLTYFAAGDHARMVARCLAGLGCTALDRAELDRAVILLAVANRLLTELPAFLPESELQGYERTLATARHCWSQQRGSRAEEPALDGEGSTAAVVAYALAGRTDG